MDWVFQAGLFAIGLGTGVFATLIGIGGGLVMVPVLMLIYGFPQETAVGTSLTVMVLNALSGSLSYARQRRIDFGTGLVLAVCSLPGAPAGFWLKDHVPPAPFRLIFSGFLVAVFFLIVSRRAGVNVNQAPEPLLTGGRPRRFTDGGGVAFEYRVSWGIAGGVSVFVGVLSNFLGIGGGMVHVPMLYRGFGVPIHVATATSLFALFFTSFAGTILVATAGEVDWNFVPALGIGIVVGAQLGAELARRLKASAVVKIIAVLLLVAAEEMVRKAL